MASVAGVSPVRYAILLFVCALVAQATEIDDVVAPPLDTVLKRNVRESPLSAMMRPIQVEAPGQGRVRRATCVDPINSYCIGWSNITNYCKYTYQAVPLTSLCCSCGAKETAVSVIVGAVAATTAAACVDTTGYTTLCPALSRAGICSLTVTEMSTTIAKLCPLSCNSCATTAATTTTKAATTTTTTKTATTIATTVASGSVPTCAYGQFTDGVSCEECGITSYTNNVKIVGGVAATAHSWPAIAQVYFTYKGNVSFSGKYEVVSVTYQCAGTLINRYNVMTAAHCYPSTVTVYNAAGTRTATVLTSTSLLTPAQMFTVYLGAQALDDSSSVKYSVSRVTKHASFNEDTLKNDILMLRLSTKVTLTTNIQVACLPTAATFPATSSISDVYGVGWGTTTEDGNVAQTLQNVKLALYDVSYCYMYSVTTATQICAGWTAGGKDTCQGDSGGALYAYDSTKAKYIAGGITSYGNGCARKNTPGVYTRVGAYLDWIRTNMFN